jgi:hypothetical protein
MRLSGTRRPIIFGFVLAIGITLTLPYLAFGAAHSGRFRGAAIHRQGPFLHPINRFGLRPFNRFGLVPFPGFGWFGGGVYGEQLAIIIQQFQPPVAALPSEATENRIYVQPRWVDGGYGVQVLQPGYWADPKQLAERRP